jgi:hypothetical protein
MQVLRWLAMLALVGCGPSTPPAAGLAPHETTIDDLNEAQAINFVASAGKDELAHNLAGTRLYRFRNVIVVGNATCGEVRARWTDSGHRIRSSR